ncbi:MAG: hypothetical protein MPN21_15055 [Thermoanaerobaculia bacterium]|nr:hypothetical protein [Thermoanaerobaculia bacterium]
MSIPRVSAAVLALLLVTASSGMGQSASERVEALELRWWAEDVQGGIFDVARTPDGMIWAATGEGLLRLDGAEAVRFLPGVDSSPTRLPNGPAEGAPQAIRAVEHDGSGGLVVALDGGAYRFDDRRFLVLSRPGVGGRPWSARLLMLDRDRVLWVAAADTLLRLQPNAFSLRQGLPGVAVDLLWEDPFGYLWATTESGQVFRRLGNAFQPVNFPLGLGDSQVHCLHLGPDGLLWLLRSDGAWIVDGDFSRAGLPRSAGTLGDLEDLTIHTCSSEPDGGLWLGTENGLVYRSVDGQRSRVPGVDAAVRSIVPVEGDSLWIATEVGLAQLYDPSAPVLPPSVLVIAAAVDDEEVAVGERFDLPSNTRMLHLTLSAPSFRSPSEVRLRYRWGQEIAESWTELGGNELMLDNLPVGESQLTLQAGLGDRWNEPGTKLRIRREPALWQMRAFWGAIGAGFGALMVWLLYLRWVGPGPSPLDMPEELDDDIVHLEDLDTEELRVSRETVERARRNIFRDDRPENDR